MDTVKINATTRKLRGKGGARESRREGLVPGILYGQEENLPLAVDRRELDGILRTVSSGNAIFDVQLKGRESEEFKAIIKEVQRHPVSEAVVHFDFEHIRMDQKVRVHVPVHLLGTAVGIKEGGILEHLTRELELDCVAALIPASIDVDVTHLERNDSIHVRDIQLGENMHIVNPPDQVVAMVVAPTAEEAAPAVAAAVVTPEVAPAKAAPGKAAPGKAAPGKAGPSKG
jgi:large subunit ribosomal protein L25